jgi:hypothetical protein
VVRAAKRRKNFIKIGLELLKHPKKVLNLNHRERKGLRRGIVHVLGSMQDEVQRREVDAG